MNTGCGLIIILHFFYNILHAQNFKQFELVVNELWVLEVDHISSALNLPEKKTCLFWIQIVVFI